MILLAESGSTKTQWCLVDKQKMETLVNTPGINPLILAVHEIETIMRPVLSGLEKIQVDKIFYYGAGCSTPNAVKRIETALLTIFKCKNIVVDTDLKAACLALSGNQSGVIGLLGTGSNSCVWDGQKIIAKIPSLGYVLGDEGGGVSFGKQLISDYLKSLMPEHISQRFAQKYNLSTDYVIERVYQTPMANRFLAGFAPFIDDHIDDPYCRSIVYQQFKAYFERNLLLYKDFAHYDIFFCGSIAFFHRDILHEISRHYNLSIKEIVKEPINNLAQYFQNKLLE